MDTAATPDLPQVPAVPAAEGGQGAAPEADHEAITQPAKLLRIATMVRELLEDLLVGVLRRPGLGRWLPDGAAAALTAPGDGTLPMWAGGLVFAAYGLVLALLGGRLVVRRDLT
jgi:hypothetical protein